MWATAYFAALGPQKIVSIVDGQHLPTPNWNKVELRAEGGLDRTGPVLGCRPVVMSKISRGLAKFDHPTMN
jgi:hypothetical protein